MKFRALSLLFPMKEIITEELAYVDDCGASHHNTNDPKVSPDLRDKEGTWQLTRNGYPVTGRILEEQFHMGTQSPALPVYMTLWSVVAMFSGLMSSIGIGYVGPAATFAYIVGFFLFFGALPTIAVAALVVAPALAINFIAPTLVQLGISVDVVGWVAGLVPAILPLIYMFFKVKREAGRLAYEGAMTNGAVLAAPRAQPNKARCKQDKNDIKDKSHLIVFGTASGRMAKNGDELSPDQHLPFGLKFSDLSKHMMIFGATGSGKTVSGIRQIIKGQFDAERVSGKKIGMLMLDGKAQLADSFHTQLDINIHPSTVKHLNVLQGLKPETIVAILENSNKSEKSGKTFWTTAAGCAIYVALIFREALVSVGKAEDNLSSLMKLLREMKEPCVVAGQHPITDKLQAHPDFDKEGTLVNDALHEFFKLQNSAGDMVSSIFATAESWLTPMMQSAALRPWADSTTSDFDLTQILYGMKIGISLSEIEFGAAGTLITRLIKARVFQLISERKNTYKKLGQSEVILIMDESQRLIDSLDIEIIGVAREWGLIIIYATQNLESIQQKFGADGTLVILGSCRNIITFKSDRETIAYTKDRIGKAIIWRPVAHAPMIDFGLTSKLALSNPVLDPQNPYSSWMKFHSFSVLNWISKARKVVSSDAVAAGRRGGTLSASSQPEYIVTEADIQALNEPGTALCSIERAGVPRRDIVHMQALQENLEPYPEDHEIYTAKAMFKEAA